MRFSSGINKTNARRKRKAKSICLPFASEASYPSCMEDRVQCRSYIMEQDRLQPELFPQALREGCTFHGFLHSKKQALPMRRIKLRTNGEQYQIRPSFMMPYMIGRIEEVEKALYYRRGGVPFDGWPMLWSPSHVLVSSLCLSGTCLPGGHDHQRSSSTSRACAGR